MPGLPALFHQILALLTIVIARPLSRSNPVATADIHGKPRRPRPRAALRHANARAATTLEFAIVASMFLGTTAFLADLGLTLYTQVTLDFVASRAARMLAVDSQQTLSANQTTFQAVTLCPLMAAFLACNNVTVALMPVTDYASGSIPSGQAPFSPGQGGSLMLLQLSYPLPAFAAPLALNGVFGGTQTVARFPYMNEY